MHGFVSAGACDEEVYDVAGTIEQGDGERARTYTQMFHGLDVFLARLAGVLIWVVELVAFEETKSHHQR